MLDGEEKNNNACNISLPARARAVTHTCTALYIHGLCDVVTALVNFVYIWDSPETTGLRLGEIVKFHLRPWSVAFSLEGILSRTANFLTSPYANRK